MKKLLLIALTAFTCLTASAQQTKYDASSPVLNNKHMALPAQTQRSFQAVPAKSEAARNMISLGKKLTLDASRLQPVQHSKALPTLNQRQQRLVSTTGRLASGQVSNLKPTINVKAPRKAPAFRDSYTGRATNYFERTDTTWQMKPAVAELEDGTPVNVLIDVIPLVPELKEALQALYPDGVPVEYTQEGDIITIQPQSIASYENEGTRNYITLFSANSENEDGVITMQLADDGLLKVIDGNWITYGEFAGVEFDIDMSDSEAFLGLDELFVGVRYAYDGQKEGFTSARDYNAHGVDVSSNAPVNWTMSIGTWTEYGEDIPVFLNLCPLDDIFTGLYPDGIYVEYTQSGTTYTVKPQVIASASNDDGTTDYIMLFSGTNEATGEIVFEIGDDGKLTTIAGESIMISAWSTSEYDSTFETYLGYYVYTDRVSYRLPGEPAVAPSDMCVDPNELLLFAGLGPSGYSYNDNLGMMGAYAPLTFRNATFDIATGYEWNVTESDEEENVITSTDTDFTFITKGGAVYSDLTLTGINNDAKSDPYTFGYGHCPGDSGEPRYTAAWFYAGQLGSSFVFSDGTYATMTRNNPDNDLTFYTNWGTPDLYTNASIAKIYSYQGKPATPLYFTGITIPFVGFEAKDEFNLHISLYKCTRSASGRLTLGDLIAEGDAGLENIDDQYDSGLVVVNFNELYVEDEEGMSETLDYLFVEDEFCIVIDGFDNGTFSGVIGSQDISGNELNSTWFARTGSPDEMRYYSSWKPALFIGLINATYGYLHTDDDTNLTIGADGGEASIHVYPMLYTTDDETEQPMASLYLESIKVDGEEVDDVDWVSMAIANEDYTTAIEVDEDGDEYEYFVNGIDYDLVFTAEPLPQGVESRTAEFTFMQTGALLKVKVTQGEMQGISTVVTAKPLNNSRAFNLAGQPAKTQKGIILKDGRKVIVK